jgi:hypothetical protein
MSRDSEWPKEIRAVKTERDVGLARGAPEPRLANIRSRCPARRERSQLKLNGDCYKHLSWRASPSTS